MICLLTCSRWRKFNALSLNFLLETCKSLKNIKRFNSGAFPPNWMSNSSLRDNREFLKNTWIITRDLCNLLLLKPISINFVMSVCILLLTLTKPFLFLFFSFDSCSLSRSRKFSWVVLLVVSNAGSAFFCSWIISYIISCCQSLLFFDSDGLTTKEECNPTISRRASAN